MEENSGGNTRLLLLVMVIALVVGLVGVAVVIYNIITFDSPFGPHGLTASTTQQQVASASRPVTQPLTGQLNYNFGFSAPQTTPDNSEKDNLVTQEVATDAQAVNSPQVSNLDRIIIPGIHVNGPIVQGTDGNKALDQGFWLYPSSSVTTGEKILFCHRRYWGPNHPYSCWHLDQVKTGDRIILVDKNQKQYQYQVITIAVRDANDLTSILRASDQDLLKIITCTPLGKSTQRLVVLAKAISQ